MILHDVEQNFTDRKLKSFEYVTISEKDIIGILRCIETDAKCLSGVKL